MIRINVLIIFISILFYPTLTAMGSPNYFNFDETTKRLIIVTKMMQVTIEEGAIVYIKDRASSEIFIDTNLSNNFPTSPQFPQGDPRFFLGFTSRSPEGNHYYRLPRNPAVTYQLISNKKVKVIYSPLHFGGNQCDGMLTYDVNVDEFSGEIIIQTTGIETEASQQLYPFTLDIPIMNLKKGSVILGSGAKYIRSDQGAKDKTSDYGLGLFSPSMAVIEGSRSCVAVWSESNKNLADEYIGLSHHPEYDHIILHTPQDQKQEDKRKISSSPWRLGIYKNWLEAARCWRVRFEQRTLAKPLWDNRAAWVQKIHAVHTERHYAKGSDYAQLANIVPSENLLYFMWNGDRIVLFGDHTLVAGIAAPQAEELRLIKRHGWRLLLYYPWTLYFSQEGANERLRTLNDRGLLQNNYQFNPDFEGNLTNWYAYWLDVSSKYAENDRIIHPGSTKFKNFLLRNYRNWCTTYQADGSYFDILGSDESAKFQSEKRIIEGQDYATGEKNALALLNKKWPNLPVMSEYLNSGLLPHVFYTWEGYTHVTQNVNAKTKINHPLRTALIGSYIWSREQDPRDEAEFNHEASALLGALPTLSLVGDYKVTRAKALWSQARCKLFCEEELFNDLPPWWDPEAMAYYRSKSRNWFKFKKLGEGKYAYIEELPNGEERIRLSTLDKKLGDN